MPKLTDPTDRGVPVTDLKHLFTYVPGDPRELYLYWNRVRRGRSAPGDPAGGPHKSTGHIMVRVRGIAIPAARIILAMHDNQGRWPMEPVRFRDGDPANLSLDNLFIPSRRRDEPHRNLVARELRRVNRAAVALLEKDRALSGDWFYNKQEQAEAALIIKNPNSTDAAVKAAQGRYNKASIQINRMVFDMRKHLRGQHPFKFSENHLRPAGRPRRDYR